jgi:chromosome segregation ATPase
VGQDKYDEALRINGELQSQIEQGKASLKQLEGDLQAERAKADRLTIDKADHDRQLKAATDGQEQLRRSLAMAQEDLRTAQVSLAQEQAELKRCLDAHKQAASRQEQEIADRDREIDMLKSRIRQLERELQELRKAAASAPATRP